MKHKRLISILLLVTLAVAIVSCGGSRTRKSAGDVIDDAWITTKIKSKLLADDGLSIFHIEVDTFKGTVQLSGFVNNKYQVDRAAQIARSVSGVRTVRNSLLIK